MIFYSPKIRFWLFTLALWSAANMLWAIAHAEIPPNRYEHEGLEYEDKGKIWRIHKRFDVLMSHQQGCVRDPVDGLDKAYRPKQSEACREQVPPPVFTNPKAPPFKYPEAKPQTHGLDLSQPDINTAKEYFKWLCENEAGTWIDKSVSNVEGVFAMRNRPRYGSPGEWQRFDRFYVEDPWGEIKATFTTQSTGSEYMFLMPHGGPFGAIRGYSKYLAQEGYDFYERPVLPEEEKKYPGFKYLRFNRPWPLEPSYSSDVKDMKYQPVHHWSTENMRRKPGEVWVWAADEFTRMTYPQPEPTNNIRSRYGFFWRGIERSSHDRQLSIAGGEEFYVDLKTNAIVAMRRGFVMSQWAKPGTKTKVDWVHSEECPAPEFGKKSLLLEVFKPKDPITARGIDLRNAPTPEELSESKKQIK